MIASIARPLLRTFWFVVVPALLTSLCVRFGIASPDDVGAASWERSLAEVFRAHAAQVTIGIFLVWALGLRYWKGYLPGGRWMSAVTVPEGIGRSAAPESEEAGSLTERAHRREALVLAAGILGAVVLARIGRDAIGEFYEVAGTSMLPTLEPRTNVAVNRLTRLRAPRRGDVVIFGRDDGEGMERHVKRVIGLPGDRIQMDGLAPVVNGWTVPNCKAGLYTYASGESIVTSFLRVEFLEDRAYLVLFAPAPAFTGEVIVQEGEVFVLGDNRADSRDSRTYNAGFGGGQPIVDIAGRVDFKLLDVRRDGRLGFDHLFEPLGTALEMESVDLTRLKAGIAACLENRPTETTPPEPGDHEVAYK